MAKIGIDFGLSCTRVAICKDNKIKIIKDEKKRSSFPSKVNFTSRKVCIGYETDTITGADALEEIRDVKNRLATKDSFMIMGVQEVTPEIMCAFLLKNAIKQAEKELREPVTEATISFSGELSKEKQKELMNACKIAGVEKVVLLNASIAATLAYNMVYPKNHGKYLVIDLAKETMRLSVVEVCGTDYQEIAFVSMAGLGGDCITKLIKKHIVDELKRSYNEVLPLEHMSQQTNMEFFDHAEHMKKILSKEKEVEFSFSYKEKAYKVSCSNQIVRDAATDTLIGMLRGIDTFFEENQIDIEQIDHVILAGGGVKNPVIKNFLEQIYQEKMAIKADPEEIIALGACTYGNLQESQKIGKMRGRYTNTIGVYLDQKEYHTLVKKNESFPCELKHHFSIIPEKKSKLCIQFYKGEEKMVTNNKLLYRWDIDVPENIETYMDLEFTITIDEEESLVIVMECCQTKRKYQYKLVECPDKDIETKQYVMRFLERYGKKDVSGYVREGMIIANYLPFHEAEILKEATKAFAYRMNHEKGYPRIKAWNMYYMILLKYLDVKIETVEYDAKAFFETDFE